MRTLITCASGPGVRPREVAGEWMLLGYDVANDALLSGLSNWPYREDERARFATRWGPGLNRFHLFESLTVANEFRTLTDARVPHLEPFRVFGLYVDAGAYLESRVLQPTPRAPQPRYQSSTRPAY